MRCEKFDTEILKVSVAMGGTITNEYCVGVAKLNAMCVLLCAQENERCSASNAPSTPRACSTPAR